jgi:hypothetical protein
MEMTLTCDFHEGGGGRDHYPALPRAGHVYFDVSVTSPSRAHIPIGDVGDVSVADVSDVSVMSARMSAYPIGARGARCEAPFSGRRGPIAS